ncbi:MAG: DUF1778 domain-containing protein [Alteromonadaceae bacterium]|nr:DUF1778 domain-containing protein [Alteromonadaceae bacterium]
MNKETKTRSEKNKTTGQSTKLNQEAWEKLNKIISKPPKPTQALRDLMKNS